MVNTMVVLGGRLDWMILKVFSNLQDSVVVITKLEYTEFFNNHRVKYMSAIYSQKDNKNLHPVQWTGSNISNNNKKWQQVFKFKLYFGWWNESFGFTANM